ncbi:MAG: LamG-like jellyroll fold domain-containing protein [Caldilineaceae bacterium]
MTTRPLTSLKVPKRLAALTALVLVATVAFGALWWPDVTRAATRLTTSDPVTAAWEKARAAGSYAFTSDVLQKTIPVASLANVGRSSRSEALYLEGQNNLRTQTLELTLWSQGGSALNADSGVSLRTENGKTYTRRGGRSASSAEPWQEGDNFTEGFAPQGDFLGYLVAIRDVTAGATETRGGITFTRYAFTLDGPAFANYMHEQMTVALRAKGELPPGVQLDAPAYYRNMTGSGELWVGENGLPVRQILTLNFPEQNEERVEAAITVNFSNYGAEQTELWTLLRTGQWQGAWLVLPSRLPDLTGLWLGLTLSIAAFLVVRYRRVRALQVALVSAVIVSQIVGPVLSAMSQARFFDSYRAKAAAQEEKQAAATQERELRTAVQSGTEFNPHQNPLELGRQEDWQLATQSPTLSVAQSPALQVADPGTDSDGDTLTDFTEVRINTSEIFTDTDDDGLTDNLEVNGFTMGGQTWYTDPNAQDSNRDGLADVLEWGLDSNGDLRTAPFDTDTDGLPDLFDPDNDNDGVPDRMDSAPFVKGAVTYSEDTPLTFSVNNLTPDKPTFVEFQIRPQDAKNLSFAHNVLDWPQDSDGQMRDVDGKTYADLAATQGRVADGAEANGDMKVVPMLEIRIPNTSANLPSQAELTPFNISINDFSADGQTKVAYVPLSIVTDEQTGERVAFNGEMRYKPTGSWTAPHSVRLAWMVQALNDLPCDPMNAADVEKGCQPDGYVHNQPVMLHSYYDNWTLTGLTVREDHGSSMAILYEDPAVDPNPKDEAALWALSLVLDHHFMNGRDENNDKVRDLKVSDLATHFDHTNNPSEAQRFAIPNTLKVVTNSYATGAEATAATVMTETLKILDTTFKPVVAGDNAVKPLLLFAQEQNMRVVSLDQVAAGEGSAAQNGANLTLTLTPATGTAQPVSVVAGLKWMAYCGANGNNVAWRPCTSDEYADVIEARYASAPRLPTDVGPNEAAGRMVLTMGYYASLTAGYGVTVQEGPAVISSKYRLESESETATRVRAGLNSLAPVPLLMTQTMQRVLFFNTAGRVDYYTRLSSSFENLLEVIGKSYAQLRVEVDIETNNLHIDNGLGGPKKPVTKVRLSQIAPREMLQIRMARLSVIGVAGGVLAAVTTALSAVPDLNVTARTVLGVVAVATTTLTNVILPVATIVYSVQSVVPLPDGTVVKTNWGKILTKSTLIESWQKVGGIVGLAISLGLIWGFFIGGAAASGYTAGSPQINKAFFEAVAATIVTVLLAVLSVTVIGTIIVGIITAIDTLFNLICELGVSALRFQGNFYGGACFSLTTSATKVLAYFLYNYEPMINTSRSDLMVTGSPHLTLTDPTKGYVPANKLTLTLPVTTTVVHKDPDPANGLLINLYLWLYSPDNLRTSTFKYGLSQGAAVNQAVDLNQMPGAWQDVREDHKYVLTPMYRGVATTDPAPLTNIPLVQGINSTVPFSLTMNFAIPAYECWTLWIPGTPVLIPVCYPRELENSNTMPFTMLKYDVLPNTLTEFLALGNKPNSGLGQSWDARLPALADADGDGLRSAAVNGLDPNDSTWDADGDGLSDRFELDQRAVGVGYSPILRDTDGDGLTDKQEAELGTNPLVADTDNDGLTDGVEIRHQVYDANGKLTNTWAGGWQVTINSNPTRTVWVSSDPYRADTDKDGISDQAEKDLAASASPLDDQGVPYHPTVPNTPPLAVLTESSALSGYIGPNQQLTYTTTVVANVPVEPGMLEVTVPANQNFTPAPAALPFNTLTFSGSQTVTQAINFTALPNGALGTLDLLSTASARLQRKSGLPWVVEPVTTGAALSGFTPPLTARSSALLPARDRADSYLLSSVVLNPTFILNGDVRGYNLTTGASTVLASGALVNNTSYFPRSNSGTDLAANAYGTNVSVWDQRDYCRTVTINSLKVVTAFDDVGGGIEPFITIVTNDRTTSEQVWYWDAAGGAANMTAGQQRGPNAGGFPLTRTLCGLSDIQVWESDGPVNIPAQNELVRSNEVVIGGDYSNFTMIFEGAGHRIDLNINIPQEDLFTVGGARLNGDGVVQAPLIFPRPAISPTAKLQMFNPVVASDGDSFLALYEATIDNSRGPRGTQRYLVAQAFDRDGVARGNSFRLIATPDFSRNFPATVYDLAWIGDRYRVVWKANDGATISSGDINSSGAFQGTGWTTLVTDASTTTNLNLLEIPYTPQLAAEPRGGATERWILTYNRGANADTVVLLYPTRDSTTASNSRIFFPSLESRVAYNPLSRGWLVGMYYSYNLTAYPLNPDLSDLTPLVDNIPPFVLPTGSSYVSHALACPLTQSLPAAEFRFEELPNAGVPLTSFSDSSGLGRTALCGSGLTPTTANCPTPGASGAPNAPLSDYAAQFNGAGDRMTFSSNEVADIFTVALWVKAAPNANPDAYLITNTNFQTTFWYLGLKNGIPQLVTSAQSTLAGTARIDDDNWHHVAATFNVLSGIAVLYVDGVQVASRTATLGTRSTLYTIGAANNGSNAFKGTIDHVQAFGTDLAASTVAALYNRTLQQYCVASGASDNGADIRWGKLTVRENDLRGGRITASGGLKVIVDNAAPTAQYTSHPNYAVVAPDTVIGGTANDSGIGVGKVEVSLNGGPWQLATGANTWSFALNVPSGIYGVRVRATDLAGNVGIASQSINVWVDETAPALTINAAPTTLKPTKNAAGQWQVPLSGIATDDHDLQAGSLLVQLTQASGVGVAQTQQAATLTGNNWSINYLLDPSLFDPTGAYTVTAQVDDSVGNRTVAAPQVVRLDASGPVAALSTVDLARTVITQTLTIAGVISDINSTVGLDKLEIAFTPIEQIAALPVGLTSDQAEAQLNRQWLPVTLSQRGAGVAQTTWSVAIPTGLENSYQIDLRGYDLLGNVSITSGLWQGMIDTRDPRVVMSATATGATYVDTADNTQRYEVRFVCAVQDRNLDESSFVCPGEGLAEPVRSFENNPALQALFPDLTLRTGLAISYTLWTTTTTPTATARACDAFGRCTQTSTGVVVVAAAGGVASAAVASTSSATAAPAAPLAVIINPTNNSFVAAGSALSVTVAAEAGAGLKEVTIKLDNGVVQTLSFAQSPAITRTLRTVNVPVATEGLHTLVAQATAWDNVSQTTLFPVVFTLDQNAPVVTIDASALTLVDTWQAQSGILRFHGNASDSVGLAAVQIREGNNGFSDATFGNGTWHVALPVADPEGRTLNITVRAIDRAGRITQQSAPITTQLSAADAPDTTISSGPANPSAVNTAQFVFIGSATAAAFECSLDNGVYTLCASPTIYNDLSKGSHTFLVRAIDGRGLPDLTPATYNWSVSAGQPDVTITGKPTHPTTERTATFTFVGGTGAASFECSLDGSPYAACTSPMVYNNLGNGEHTFLVRARNNANLAGAAERYVWTVNNVAPVAQSQSLISLPNTAIPITLTATDNEPLIYKIVTPPGRGVLVGIPPNVTYLPDKDNGLTDRFTFLASDGLLDSNVATVTVVLDNVPPVVTVTGVTNGGTYSLGNVPAAGCNTVDLASGVAVSATMTVKGGNAHGVGNYTATCSPASDKIGNISLPVTALYTVTYNLNKFVVLAQEGVAFNQGITVNSGDIGARITGTAPFLSNNAEVSLGQNSKIVDTTSHLLGNTISLGQNASAYNLSYNSLRNNGKVLGVTATPLNLKFMPSLPALPTITAGTAAVNVAQNGSLTLNPGNYGAFNSNQNATITFKGGVYQFASFSAGQNAKLYFQAATEIRVAGRVSIGQGSLVIPAATATSLTARDIVFYVAGRNGTNGGLSETPKAVSIGQNSTLKLNLLAPNGTVQMDQTIVATGAFMGRWVSWGQNSTLTLASRFVTGASTATVQEVEPVVSTPPTEEAVVQMLYLPLISGEAVGSETMDSETVDSKPVELAPEGSAPSEEEQNSKLFLPAVSR